MPIFMDRHDILGATPEDLFDAHRRDIECQGRYGVKYMTYWFDKERGSAFCLVEAPDAATAERVHREAERERTGRREGRAHVHGHAVHRPADDVALR